MKFKIAIFVAVSALVIGGCYAIFVRLTSAKVIVKPTNNSGKRTLNIANARFETEVRAPMRLAAQKYAQGNVAESLSLAKAVRSGHPGVVEAEWMIAKGEAALGHRQLAEEAAIRFLSPNPNGGSTDQTSPARLLECMELADRLESSALRTKVADVIGKRPRTQISLAGSYVEASDSRLSKKAYCYLVLGNSLRVSKNAKAIALLELALLESPKHPMVHLALCEAYLVKRETDLALKHLHQCLIRLPNSDLKQALVRKYNRNIKDVITQIDISSNQTRYFKVTKLASGEEVRTPYVPFPYLETSPLPNGQ